MVTSKLFDFCYFIDTMVFLKLNVLVAIVIVGKIPQNGFFNLSIVKDLSNIFKYGVAVTTFYFSYSRKLIRCVGSNEQAKVRSNNIESVKSVYVVINQLSVLTARQLVLIFDRREHARVWRRLTDSSCLFQVTLERVAACHG